MTPLADTGERILLEKESALMIARHMSAYTFAGSYAAGKTVLDIGCGQGYGSFYLTRQAKKVTGIDYDPQVIVYAQGKYRKENLDFDCIRVEDLRTLKRKFGLICSFQCIEHIKEPRDFLRCVRALLEDQGVFLCSTPNKEDASPNSPIPLNKFHLKEYSQREFSDLLAECFNDVTICSLKRGPKLNFYRCLKKAGLCNCLPDSINPVKNFYRSIKPKHFIIRQGNSLKALDFIALCRT